MLQIQMSIKEIKVGIDISTPSSEVPVSSGTRLNRRPSSPSVPFSHLSAALFNRRVSPNIVVLRTVDISE